MKGINMISTSLRKAAFDQPAFPTRQSWRQIDFTVPELRIYALLCIALLAFAVAISWCLDRQALMSHAALQPLVSPKLASIQIKPLVPAERWRKFQIAETAPAQLNGLSPDSIQFQNRNMLPVARVDGVEIDGTLPRAIWIKLEQPGNAIVLLETNSGTFVKTLQEVSPGFISRCQLDADGFGTLDGEPANISIPGLQIKALWVIQDAAASAGQTPGWIAIAPPGDKIQSLPPDLRMANR